MNFNFFNCFVTLFLLTLVCGWEKDFGCYDDTIRLQCKLTDIIVIRSASYSTEIKDQELMPKQCYNNSVKQNGENCSQDLRLLFNSKCSGLQFCRFNVERDIKDPFCNNSTGYTSVSYKCVQKKTVKRFCGEVVNDHEGFIASPGYPNYYPPLYCNWTIKVKPEQKIELRILDLSIKPIPKKYKTNFTSENFEKDCQHYVRVMDGKRRALHICGQSPKKLKPVKIYTESVNVILHSDGFWSARGFLMYYRVFGCTDLTTPENGYLVQKSETTATFMCCIGYVFPDSINEVREMFCENDFKWNKTLPNCIAIKEVASHKNMTNDPLLEFRIDKPKCESDAQSQGTSLITDIIIPSVIICTVIVLNGFIVLCLLRKRRLLRETRDDEEFLKEPNQHREPSTSVTSATTSYG